MRHYTHFLLRASSFILSLTLVPLSSSQVTGQRSADSTRKPTARPHPLRIAVLPFVNTLGDSETALLKEGILDSISSTLRYSHGLSAVDQAFIMDLAQEQQWDLSKVSDAVKLGKQLDVNVVVMGSYQRLGNQIRLEARMIAIPSGEAKPGWLIRVDGAYPGSFFQDLETISQKIIAALKVPISQSEKDAISSQALDTRSLKAYQLYSKGRQIMRSGSEQSLNDAIELFQQALNVDPKYSDAMAAVSEAELRLADMQQKAGQDASPAQEAARQKAEEAGRIRPKSGRVQRALSQSRAAAGDYAGAEEAAIQAVRTWQSDASARLDLARARGHGQPVNDDLENALWLGPWLVRAVKDLPVVTVENRVGAVLQAIIGSVAKAVPSKGSAILLVAPGNHSYRLSTGPAVISGEREFTTSEVWTIEGDIFPHAQIVIKNETSQTLSLRVGNRSMKVPAKGSRAMNLFAGSYPYQATIGEYTWSGTRDIEPGDQEWTFSGGTIPTGTLTVENIGRVALRVVVSGPTRRTFSVSSGASHTVTVLRGDYTVSGTIYTGQMASENCQVTAGEEATVRIGYH